LSSACCFGCLRNWCSGLAIEHRVAGKTASLALIEQRRSASWKTSTASVAAEIVEEITELVSSSYRALLLVQIADGATLGNCPPS